MTPWNDMIVLVCLLLFLFAVGFISILDKIE